MQIIECHQCSRELSKDEVGLNKKLIEVHTQKGLYLCLDCLADYLDVTTEELLAKIEDFKEDGCKLFS